MSEVPPVSGRRAEGSDPHGSGSESGVLVREGWTLNLLTGACPEQYEVVDHQGEVKSYYRLRWGHFFAACPDVGGEVVFSHTWEDDEYKGCFDTEDERRTVLDQAMAAVDSWWRSRANVIEEEADA